MSFAIVSLVLAFVGLSAARDVWLHVRGVSLSLSDTLLLAFLPVTAVAFVAWLAKRDDASPSPYSADARRPLIWLNLSTAGTYGLLFASLALGHARTADGVGIAFIPFFTLALGKRVRERAAACVAIVLGCIVLSSAEIAAPFRENEYIALIGVLAAVLGGLFAALNIIFSRRLGELKIKPAAIFGARFWLLMVLAAAGSLGQHLTSPSSGPVAVQPALWVVPLVGLLGIVVPLYAFQHLIATSSRLASFVVPMVPPVVFFLELAVEKDSRASLVGVITGVIGVVIASAGIYLGLRDSSISLLSQKQTARATQA